MAEKATELMFKDAPLLRVSNLKKYFPIRKGAFMKVIDHVRAVDDISFDVREGQTLGLAGESGCGKTTAGRCIVRLMEASGGEVSYKGSENLLELDSRQMQPYREKMQMVFQNPYASLNPRMTVGSTLAEPLKIFRIGSNRQQRRERIKQLLEQVGLSEDHINRFPHEFSGGQRQRIAIARSLSVNPKMIIADEAVSALDVSIQAQILNLMKSLQDQLGLSYIFISHNLSVVQYMSDWVAIMYLGKIVEMASKKDIYENPKHPYTKLLMAAIPIPDPGRKVPQIEGGENVAQPVRGAVGCRFCPRCPEAMPICSEEEPTLLEQDGHKTACHIYRNG